MRLKSFLILVPCALFSICLFAQKKKKSALSANRVVCSYGEVKPEDFSPKVYAIDSAAEAVYLFDGAKSEFEGNQDGDFDVLYQVHTRIRLLNKNAFHLATVEVPLYVSNTLQQKISDLQATTYTLSGGAVESRSIDKKDIFGEKTDDLHQVVKFTLPGLSEGCIIEYSYKLKTPGPNNLFGWVFQKNYPVLWSEYEVKYPLIFDYIQLKQGYHPYVLDTAIITRGNYRIGAQRDAMASSNQDYFISANVANAVWAMQNVPTLKREPFTTTLGNHIAKIDFQLSTIRYSDNDVRSYMRNWKGTSDTLLRNEYYYGKAWESGNYFLTDEVKTITAGATTKLEEARKIYEYVRDHFTAVEVYPWAKQPLRKVYQQKKGTTAEVNLVLAGMLRAAGFQVSPVLLSTADHGKAYREYPVLDKYNYTICGLVVDGKTYLLDAADSRLGFNKLRSACYNGYARVINPANPALLDLSPDSLRESTMTSVFIINDGKGGQTASVSSVKGYDASVDLREQWTKKGTSEYFQHLKTAFPDGLAVSNTHIDSIALYDYPVKVSYDVAMQLGDDEIIYFNPLLFQEQKDNPFAAAERYYPVEMPYCIDESYVLNMQIPEGYAVDEMPKNSRVLLNESDGMFEYLITANQNQLQMRTRLKLNKALFEPEDYQTLRDLYAFVVKKQAEQVVFKKIK